MQTVLLQGKTVRWAFPSSVSALNSGGQPWQELLKIISLFAMVFRVPETQASLVFRARCFGGHPSGQRLKCWGTTGWVQPLHASQAGIFKFSPDCVLCAGGGFFWKEFISVRILFAVGFSSFAQCAGVTLQFLDSFQRIFFCVQL